MWALACRRLLRLHRGGVELGRGGGEVAARVLEERGCSGTEEGTPPGPCRARGGDADGARPGPGGVAVELDRESVKGQSALPNRAHVLPASLGVTRTCARKAYKVTCKVV